MDNMMGKEAQDKITGIKGIIVGKCQYLFGCTQYGIAPKASKDGKRIDTEWFDEGRIEVIGKGVAPKSVQSQVDGPDRQFDAPHRKA